jgi:hypothetical protein
MNLEVQVHEENTHLSIKAVGNYSLANLYDLFTKVKDESQNRSGRGVILDITEVAGAVSVLDMLVLGEYCSKYWKYAFRVAIVTSGGGLNRFFENVARNRGVQIAVVRNEGEAMDWLT